MKRISKIGLIIFFAILMAGCEDVLETNISSQQVVLLSPPDSLVSTLTYQNFWWQELAGADNYNLQIVSPSFTYIKQLITDTTLYSTKFSYSLLPGIYEWRVKAVNFGYETPYTINRLIIDSTPDISHQIIRLIVPPDRDTTNQAVFLFDWEGIYNADNYNFQLFYQDTQVISQVLVADSATHSLVEGDGSYTWKVRGQNATSNTPYSSRSIYLDTEAPGTPQLITPVANASLPDTIITFSWNRPSQSGSSVRDSLIIARDSLFNQPMISVFVPNTTYQVSLGKGTFFWRVRSIDKAGNRSEFTPARKLIIKVIPLRLTNTRNNR